VDVDSLLRRTYGKAKQGAGFGHTKVGGYPVLLRGLSPLVATICTDTAAPVIAATRLRGGNAGSARGAASLVAEALGTAREIGAGAAPGGVLLLRGDSAFYTGAVVAAARRAGARFSITVSMNPAVRRAIARIDEAAWIPIRYPNAVWDDDAGAWISEAEVAETAYTAFAGTKHEITARLVARRVRRQAPPGQDELLPAYRYHAFFTDTALSAVDADLAHRAHAVVEQVFADLIDGPPGAPAVGSVRRQRRLVDLCRDRAQPAARRRRPDQPQPCPRSRADPAPTVHPRRGRGRPPRPRCPTAPAPPLAMGRLVDAAVRGDPQPAPSCLTTPAGHAPPDGSRSPQPPPLQEAPGRARQP
jgi:hypothetical protein